METLSKRIVKATVKIRRGGVKKEAEALDGKVIQVSYGWKMTRNDPYPGEDAYIIKGENPAILWIASGDLIFNNNS